MKNFVCTFQCLFLCLYIRPLMFF